MVWFSMHDFGLNGLDFNATVVAIFVFGQCQILIMQFLIFPTDGAAIGEKQSSLEAFCHRASYGQP